MNTGPNRVHRYCAVDHPEDACDRCASILATSPAPTANGAS